MDFIDQQNADRIMKRVLLFLGVFVLLTSSGGVKEYVSMKECGNDTLKYVRTNYVDNMERYVGKTMKYLLDYLCLHGLGLLKRILKYLH